MYVSQPVYSCELDQFVGVGMFCQMWALCEAFRKWNGFGDDVVAEQPSLVHVLCWCWLCLKPVITKIDEAACCEKRLMPFGVLEGWHHQDMPI